MNNQKDKGSKKVRFTYKNSGVDIDAANKMIGMIKKPVFSTFNKNVLNNLGSFSGLYLFEKDNYKNPVLVSSTDGVGTKLILARETGLFDNVGQDLVAMCINDIICCGAKPLFFLDYIACGKLIPEKIQAIVSSIAWSCKECNTVLIGGETAEMPGLYSEDEIDLAGFVVGVVEKDSIINPGMVSAGDLVFGIESSGFHSNGYSLIRKIIKEKNINLKKDNLGEKLMEPTRLYSSFINGALDYGIKINGIANITGGGFYENINRIIPDNMDVKIESASWEVPGPFIYFKEIASIDDCEMFRVFNMGIGMVIIISPGWKDGLLKYSRETNESIYLIGSVQNGSGKVIIER